MDYLRQGDRRGVIKRSRADLDTETQQGGQGGYKVVDYSAERTKNSIPAELKTTQSQLDQGSVPRKDVAEGCAGSWLKKGVRYVCL